MGRVRFSPEFAQVFGNLEEWDVESNGSTVRERLHDAAARLGSHVEEAIFRGSGDGELVAYDIKILVDGRELEGAADLDRRVGDEAELVVTPLKGHAQAMDNV